MPVNMPVGKLKGRNLFVTIQWVSSYILLISTMIIVFVGAIDFLFTYFLCIFIYLITFVAIQEFITRKHVEKNSGVEILDAWIDLDFNLGEEFLFPIEKIDEFPAISPNAQEAVNKFIEGMGTVSKHWKGIDIDEEIGSLDNELDNIEKMDKKRGLKKNQKVDNIEEKDVKEKI